MKTACCVPDCPRTGKIFRRFPRPCLGALIFKIWLLRIANKRFEGLTADRIYRSYRVCDLHFSEHCRVPDCFPVRLKRGSLPTLLLPGFSGESNEVNSLLYLLQRSGDSEEIKLLGEDTPPVQIEETPPVQTPIEEEPQLEIQIGQTSSMEEEIEEFVYDPQPAFQKPYFKSLKSYSEDNNSISEVCRICFRSIQDQDMIKLYEDEKIKGMLSQVLPDLDLEVYPNSVSCTECTNLIVYSFELKETWLATEEKLQRIIEKKRGVTQLDVDVVIVAETTKDPIDLQPVQEQFDEHDYAIKPTETVDSLRNVLNCDRPDEVPEIPEVPKFLLGNKVWGLGPYMCEICGMQYNVLSSFRGHLYRHKTGEPQDIMCEVCGEVLPNIRKLKQHSLKHMELKYECKKCGKKFQDGRALKLHIKHVHCRIYSYCQCHVCGKRLAHRPNLKAHLLTHTSKRPFPCVVCNKMFNTADKLKRHLPKHCDSKLECQYCGKAIKYEITLKKHIQIYHMNEGKFNCDYCGRPYWKKMDLNKHKIRVHGWAPGPPASPRAS